MSAPATPPEPPAAGNGKPRNEGTGLRADRDRAIDAAIDAGCGSLVALEASLATLAGLADVEQISSEHAHAESSIRTAMELMRSTITELQRMRARSPLSLGFVRGRRPREPRQT